jgi:hypothetical protein
VEESIAMVVLGEGWRDGPHRDSGRASASGE